MMPDEAFRKEWPAKGERMRATGGKDGVTGERADASGCERMPNLWGFPSAKGRNARAAEPVLAYDTSLGNWLF